MGGGSGDAQPETHLFVGNSGSENRKKVKRKLVSLFKREYGFERTLSWALVSPEKGVKVRVRNYNADHISPLGKSQLEASVTGPPSETLSKTMEILEDFFSRKYHDYSWKMIF